MPLSDFQSIQKRLLILILTLFYFLHFLFPLPLLRSDLVEGGAAERQGKIQKGDILVGVTAVKVIGAKWERRLLPARPFDFDTVVGAISSNDVKWGCDDVILSKYDC